MIVSAWVTGRSPRVKATWASVLDHASWILPFVVVAEMRWGAEVADWGVRRRESLERVVAVADLTMPDEAVTAAYVRLRTWCTQAGHGLGAKPHEADRWVAAVAVARGLPLASEDAIFAGVPMLTLASPVGG